MRADACTRVHDGRMASGCLLRHCYQAGGQAPPSNALFTYSDVLLHVWLCLRIRTCTRVARQHAYAPLCVLHAASACQTLNLTCDRDRCCGMSAPVEDRFRGTRLPAPATCTWAETTASVRMRALFWGAAAQAKKVRASAIMARACNAARGIMAGVQPSLQVMQMASAPSRCQHIHEFI